MRALDATYGDYIVVWKSASLLTGYAPLQTGNWLGLGSGQYEAPACIKESDGQHWRLYADAFNAGTGVHYMRQLVGGGDWMSGSAPAGAYAWTAPALPDMPVTTHPRAGKPIIV
jgi:hypothetical protein